MPTPKNRKLIQITTEAYEHLVKLRKAQERSMYFSSLSLTTCASVLILSTPIKNGNGRQPMATDLCEE